MTELVFLNSREVKRIHKQLEEQYGYTGKLNYIFMRNEKKQKLYLFTKDVEKLDLEQIRIDTMGLYFGAVLNNHLRLTIEGAQRIGPECTKNCIPFSKEEMQTWMLGNPVQKSCDIAAGTLVLVQYNDDFLGCGKYTGETILNYIPKTRYIHALY